MASGWIRRRELKNGAVRYDACYRDGYGKERSKTFAKLGEAKAFLNETVRKIFIGDYQPLKPIGFKDFAKLWLDTYAAPNLKDTTLTDYKLIIKNHLEPHFGDIALAAIRVEDCQKLVAKKLEAGLSPKTINNILVPLKLMLKHAVRWGYLKVNPADYIEKPRVRKRKPLIIPLDKIKAFLGELKEPYRTIVITIALTGLRRGEVLALKDEDIDFEKSKIFVRRSFSRGKLTTPKSEGSERFVALPDLLASILLMHIARRQIESDEGWLFVNANARPINGDNMYKRHYKPALIKAGIDKKANLHSLRHTLATYLIEQGASVKVVQDILGHADASTTLNIYAHAFPNSAKEALDRFAKDLLKAD